MTKRNLLILALSLPLLLLAAATYSGDHVFSGGRVSFGTGGILQIPKATSLPGTCEVGDVFFDSDAAAGQNQHGCTATDTWTLQGGGGGYDPTANFTYAYFEDEFPCLNIEDGEGMLPWGTIGTPIGTGCGGSGQPPGALTIRHGTGNTIFGLRLGAVSGTSTPFLPDATNKEFTAVWRFRTEDLTECFYRIGFADDQYAENYSESASGSFIGVQFQNNTANCNSVLSHTNWQALVRTGTNTSGFQDLGVAPVTSVNNWLRIRKTASGVEVCIQSTSGAPTWATGCYEETTGARIGTSSVGMGPVMISSSCDNGASTNAGIVHDRFAAKVER